MSAFWSLLEPWNIRCFHVCGHVKGKVRRKILCLKVGAVKSNASSPENWCKRANHVVLGAYGPRLFSGNGRRANSVHSQHIQDPECFGRKNVVALSFMQFSDVFIDDTVCFFTPVFRLASLQQLCKIQAYISSCRPHQRCVQSWYGYAHFRQKMTPLSTRFFTYHMKWCGQVPRPVSSTLEV